MNLVQINERLKDLPMQVVQQYANGMNPEVPPYLALGELQRRELQQKQMATAQGAMQGPQPSVKEQVEQKAGLMELQQMQQQQMAQQMVQPRGPMPTPAGVPQPEDQPEVEMARGGLANIPVRSDMFDFAGGGIVAFNGETGSDVKSKYETRIDKLYRENREAEERKKRALDAFNEQLRNDPAQVKMREEEQAFEALSPAEKSADRGRRLKEFFSNLVSSPPAAVVQAPMAAPLRPAAPTSRPTERMTPQQMEARMAPVGLPGAAQQKNIDVAATSRVIPTGEPRPAAATEPQVGLPAAAQNANPYEARLNELALKQPVAPTTQEAISRVSELSPAAMQEAALQRRNQEMRDRAAAYREQFEKGRPSGLDDLIRVFGQAGQYKGLSGLAPAYTANQQQKRAEELAMARQYNELMNLADTKELEGAKEVFGARTRAFDRAQELFGKEKDQVVKATSSLYETTQSRIDNELKRLSDMDIKKLELAQRERERRTNASLNPNAMVLEYAGLMAKSREMREKGNIKEADALAARANDLMTFKGGAGATGAERNDIKATETLLKNQQTIISDPLSSKEDKEEARRKAAEYTRQLEKLGGISGAGGASNAGIPLPQNASAKNLVVGTVYQTAKGPAKWTGTGFMPI
jgi:hypothetical protein